MPVKRFTTVAWLCGAVWIGSWYLMWLEVTRWHHVKPSLAFNSDPMPGSGIQPHPGQALILLYVACVLAPLVVLVSVAMRLHRGRERT